MMIIAYIIAGLAIILITFQIVILIKMKFRKGRLVPELGLKYSSLSGSEKTLLYFYSPSCSACRQMTPAIEELSGRNKNIIMVNVIEEIAIAEKLGVLATPTLVLVQNSVIKEFIVGTQNVEKIKTLLE